MHAPHYLSARTLCNHITLRDIHTLSNVRALLALGKSKVGISKLILFNLTGILQWTRDQAKACSLIVMWLTKDVLTENHWTYCSHAMKLSWRGLERYPKPVSPPMLLNDRRINFYFGLWLWCHPSKSLPGSAWQQAVSWQKEAKRADSSCLKSDMENVILLSQRMNLISWYLPTQAHTSMRILWGSMLSKHIRHHDVKTHQNQFMIWGQKENTSHSFSL